MAQLEYSWPRLWCSWARLFYSYTTAGEFWYSYTKAMAPLHYSCWRPLCSPDTPTLQPLQAYTTATLHSLQTCTTARPHYISLYCTCTIYNCCRARELLYIKKNKLQQSCRMMLHKNVEEFPVKIVIPVFQNPLSVHK